MAPDVKVHIKQRCVTEFLHAEKIASIDIHQHLQNIYGDQALSVSTVRGWLVHSSSGDSGIKDHDPDSHAQLSHHEERLDQFPHVNWLMVAKALKNFVL